MAVHLGVDLGTQNIQICQKDSGIILREPTVAAVDTAGNVVAVGTEALLLRGRAPGTVTIRRPMESNTITDFNLAAEFLDRCLEIAAPRAKKHITAAVKYGLGSRGRDLLTRALSDCRTGRIELVDSAPLSLAGSGYTPPSNEAETFGGTVICDIGAGSVEASYIRSGELLRTESKVGGGDRADASICAHIRRKYGIIVAPSEAKDVKHSLSLFEADASAPTLAGLDSSTGMPRRISVDSYELLECCTSQIDDAAEVISALLENLPHHGEAESTANRIFLVGGGAMMPGIGEYLTASLGVDVIPADTPMDCTVKGLCDLLDRR